MGFAESIETGHREPHSEKRSMMRWNKSHPALSPPVCIHVLNGTSEDAFPHWHQGFRFFTEPFLTADQPDHPSILHALQQTTSVFHLEVVKAISVVDQWVMLGKPCAKDDGKGTILPIKIGGSSLPFWCER